MKIIKYNLIQIINVGTPEEPIFEDRPGSAVTMGYSESNLSIARAEAYNGEVTIEDDGEPEPPPPPPSNAELANQLTTVDETAVSLYKALEAQTEINTAQDEALVAIYERMM